MDRERFQELVTRAIDSLPEEFYVRLENIDVVVADWPSPGQIASVGLRRGQTLLGLYQGVPLTKRGHRYGLVAPDKITIFQKPIEAKCRYEAPEFGQRRLGIGGYPTLGGTPKPRLHDRS